MNYMLCKNWKKIIKKTDKLIFKILKKRGGGEIHCRKVKIEPHEIIPQNKKKKKKQRGIIHFPFPAKWNYGQEY